MVTKALLGDPLPNLETYTKPTSSAITTVRNTIKNYAPYWSCLKYGVKLPHDMANFRKKMAIKMADLIQNGILGKLAPGAKWVL